MKFSIGKACINGHTVLGALISGLGWFINAGGLTALNQKYPSLGPILGIVGLVYASASGKVVANATLSK